MSCHGVVVRALSLAGLAAASLVMSSPAEARGFFGLSIGLPVYAPYYGPPAYYYAPPPVVYSPPPVTYAPPAYRYQAPSSSGEQCEPYESTTTINGRLETVTGTACRQPDGTWRIVR